MCWKAVASSVRALSGWLAKAGAKGHVPEDGCGQRVVSGFAGGGKGNVEAPVSDRGLAQVEEGQASREKLAGLPRIVTRCLR